jgi:phosphohistidine phosphatase
VSTSHELYLLRHAKSDWGDPGLPDHARPLSPRGERAARDIAAHLRRRHVAPVLSLCSSALRARQTLDALSVGGEVLYEDGLYGATAGQLLERLRLVPETTPSVMLVGHNPGIQELAVLLAGKGKTALRATLAEKLPTGALVTLVFHIPWAELAERTAELSGFAVPPRRPRAGGEG